MSSKDAPLTNSLEWHQVWLASFGSAPPKPSSSEESIAAMLDRLLTGLPSVGYGHRFTPTGAAAEGLVLVRAVSFGEVVSDGPIEMVTEGTFPIPEDQRTDKRKGVSPDWVLFWPDSIVIVEFKTVATSMGLAQVQQQLDVFRHNHPGARLEHLYVTPVPAVFRPALDDAMAYTNLSWTEFMTPLLRPFGDSPSAAALAAFVAEADARRWWP